MWQSAISGLCAFLAFIECAVPAVSNPVDSPALTAAPSGPYRIIDNQILDSRYRPYLIRGTRLPAFKDSVDEDGSVATAFGPFSSTTLITIRHRLNMNAVRLPISPTEYVGNSGYRAQVDRIVRRANQLELLVIVESEGAPTDPQRFWGDIASEFRDNPNVFFAALSAELTPAIRVAGARQPVILASIEKKLNADRDVIYQVTPRYGDLKNDEDRRRLLDSISARAPILVDGMDPEFSTHSENCAALADDPAAASALIEANLMYFDRMRISWTISSFMPGKLITDYRYFNGTKLDPGWTCGEAPEAGLGMILLAHLWNTTPLGLFTVSESRGGLAIARGGLSTAYGPILAEEDMQASGRPLPKVLGNISIRITDSRGVARLAPLVHVLAGWASVSFVVPEECATGPAEVAVVRTDGSVTRSRVLITDLAPAILSVPPDGRSVAFGQVTQHSAGRPDISFPAWRCDQGKCEAAVIHLAPDVRTTVRLLGTGFRHARGLADVRVTAGRIEVSVVSIGPTGNPGTDQLTVQLPDALSGKGEADVLVTVAGKVSNVVRINCGHD